MHIPPAWGQARATRGGGQCGWNGAVAACGLVIGCAVDTSVATHVAEDAEAAAATFNGADEGCSGSIRRGPGISWTRDSRFSPVWLLRCI